MSRIALYLDEDFTVEIAVRLWDHGFDVLTTQEADNIGVSDEQQLTCAAHAQRAILTHNRREFRRRHKMWRDQSREHWGILLCKRRHIDDLEMSVLRFLQSHTSDQVRNKLFSLKAPP